MVAYQGQMDFSYQGSGGGMKLLKKMATGEGGNMMRTRGQGEIFYARQADEIFLIQLEGEALTLNTKNMLAFDSSIQWDIKSLGGAGFMAGGPSTWSCRDTGHGRGDLGRPADAPGLLPAAHLRGSAGGGVLVSESQPADQERLQDGIAHRARLRRVLPARLPRPGLRGGPALRGDPGHHVILSTRSQWRAYHDPVTSTPPQALVDELAALGPRGRHRAATSAANMFAADVPTAAPVVDPVPAILDAEAWSQLSVGLIQRMRLLDALHADLYGPRTVLGADVAPVAQLLQDPAYLRTAIGIPSRGSHSLFALTSTVARTADGSWVVLEDAVDVPDSAGTTLELRRVLSRCAPTLYRSTPLRRLHPYFDAIRTSLHQRTRADGRAGRTVVLTEDSEDPMHAFDHSWLANLLGAPMVSVGDLRSGSGTLTLRLPGLESDPGDAVDALLRLVPSSLLDPLDLGPTPLGGVTGLVEAARCGDVEIFNPLGAGLLENPELRSALPDLCRQLFHEDLLLRPAEPDLEPAGWLSMDPAGGDELVERPMVLRLLVMGTEDDYEVLPGGVGVTADDGPETLKDVWVTVPETSAVPAEGESGPGTAEQAPTTARGVLTAYPAMTRSIGSDLFWFGRYLERVDSTARLLRAVLDTVNDLDAERGPGGAHRPGGPAGRGHGRDHHLSGVPGPGPGLPPGRERGDRVPADPPRPARHARAVLCRPHPHHPHAAGPDLRRHLAGDRPDEPAPAQPRRAGRPARRTATDGHRRRLPDPLRGRRRLDAPQPGLGSHRGGPEDREAP